MRQRKQMNTLIPNIHLFMTFPRKRVYALT